MSDWFKDDPVVIPQRQVITGEAVAEKAPQALDEGKEVKKTARSVARKGTTKYRIPLSAKKAGAKLTSGGSGLKI